ncbi:hypothetical protein Fmac_001374 [Flemingia macrophylla]|uniref:Uncharacterized protein n=1 Tax=Flemingia macrophylla TaxID=520843 RepID=A0ABD1NGY5_9FABA
MQSTKLRSLGEMMYMCIEILHRSEPSVEGHQSLNFPTSSTLNCGVSTSCVSLNYMAQQVDINERMRAILVDWLIGENYMLDLVHQNQKGGDCWTCWKLPFGDVLILKTSNRTLAFNQFYESRLPMELGENPSTRYTIPFPERDISLLRTWIEE